MMNWSDSKERQACEGDVMFDCHCLMYAAQVP
jgi:hypothetical protein